jgi:hypothetical protein
VILGAVLLALGLVVVLPAVFWVGLFVVSYAASLVLPRHAEATHEGSELIATNV